MAKKRGGLAGVWDRNKGVIKAAAPIAAGFIPGVGPAVGAALGAAMGGLDRPGKGGIGLDVGGAVKGGISGYGGAKLGQAAKGGISKMFTAGADRMGGAGPLDKLTGAPKVGLTSTSAEYGGYNAEQLKAIKGLESLNGPVMPGPSASASMYGNIAAPKLGTMPKIATQMASPTGGGTGMMDAAKKAGSFLDRNQKMIGGAADRVLAVMGQNAAGQAAADQQALAQSKFDYEKEQDKMAQEKRRRLAQLTGQMFAPQMSRG